MTSPSPARMPALFLGHGSPMTVISDVPERRALERLGRALPRPTAILAITAHWETHGRSHLTAGDAPRTIHDFRGFPQALYDIEYRAPGSPELVRRAIELLGESHAVADSGWGFDHGAWGVVLPMFPDADVPMVAMSLDRSLSPAEHLALGAALAPLRDEGVLIVGSGNVIHNLAHYGRTMGTQPDWAVDFRARSNVAILAGDHATLTTFAADDQAAALAINSGEHFLPLLYALGAKRPGDGVALFSDTLDGSLSMTSVIVGDTGLLAGVQE